jgi:hypothetical protein
MTSSLTACTRLPRTPCTVRVHLDPEVEDDEGPAERPPEDVHERRVVLGEMEVGPGKAGVRDEIAAS